MRVIYVVIVLLICAVHVESQFWKYPQNMLTNWLRQGKNSGDKVSTTSILTTKPTTPTTSYQTTSSQQTQTATTTTTPTTISGGIVSTTRNLPTTYQQIKLNDTLKRTNKIKTTAKTNVVATKMTPIWSTVAITTQTTLNVKRTTNNNLNTASTANLFTETSTIYDATTTTATSQDVTATTEEPRERTHNFYMNKREKPQVKIATNISQNLLPLPAGASAALVKPTKYYYYPHNQHMYLLPECAIQQVCNAVYIRLNWTQPLCACPSRYRDPCSASLNSDDLHTTELMIDRKSKRALTLVKTCEPTAEMRICRSPRDWSLLALQNIRTGKSHYLVICRCPDSSILEGPMSHDQPTYASVPGIRVYGMMCVDGTRRGRPLRTSRSLVDPPFPWKKAKELAEAALWD